MWTGIQIQISWFLKADVLIYWFILANSLNLVLSWISTRIPFNILTLEITIISCMIVCLFSSLKTTVHTFLVPGGQTEQWDDDQYDNHRTESHDHREPPLVMERSLLLQTRHLSWTFREHHTVVLSYGIIHFPFHLMTFQNTPTPLSNCDDFISKCLILYLFKSNCA